MKKIFRYFAFAAAVLFLFIFLINKIPLWSSDEGRFGEKAREMSELKEYIVPYFNYIPYIEKPVLAYWSAALSFNLFGVHNWSARFPSVFCSLMGLLLCWCFVRKLFSQKTADWSAVILATSIGYVLVGRFAVIDMVMTFLMSGALFSLMTACIHQRRRYYLLSYVFMGLTFLAKGLIGMLLPGLVFFVFLIWTKNLREITKMHLGWGILIVAAVILPWCIAISMKRPEFFNVFIIQNHFSRFAGAGGFGRKRPIWFFIPILIATALPWSFFLPAAVADGLKREDSERIKIQFLICWASVIFIFFSIAKSKLPYYLLPVSMPVAILAATFFSRESFKDGSRKILEKIGWFGSFIASAGLALGMDAYLLMPFKKRPEIFLLESVIYAGSVILLSGITIAYLFYKKGKKEQSALAMAGMIYLSLIMTSVGILKISPYQSTFDFAQTLKPILKEADSVAILASLDHFSDFPFYLRKRLIVVGREWKDSSGDSRDPRERVEIQGWFMSQDQFKTEFNKRQKRYFCLLDEKNLESLTSVGIKEYFVVKRETDRLLISNFNN